MRIKPVGTLLLFLTLAIADVAQAQARALTGTWRRVSLRDSAGTQVQPPAAPAFAIYSANGYFSQTAIPAGRPKINKALKDLTKEELISLVENVDAWSGTYTFDGKTLTRTTVSDLDPSDEGTKLVQNVRFSGDTVILTLPNPASHAEARFVRVR